MNNDDDDPTNSNRLLLGVLTVVALAALSFFAFRYLEDSSNPYTSPSKARVSVAGTYAAIKLPAGLELVEHQSISTGQPSEVYYYSFSSTKAEISKAFITNLNELGYRTYKGTDGLIFSASGTISLNFIFSEPKQLKVTAI